MGSRWYRPNEAQFLSRDTDFGMLQTPISLNRYTYANGDPLNYFDPDGHRGICIGPCAWAKRQGQRVVRGVTTTISRANQGVCTAAAETVKTIGVQVGRAQHKLVAAETRIRRTAVQAYRKTTNAVTVARAGAT